MVSGAAMAGAAPSATGRAVGLNTVERGPWGVWGHPTLLLARNDCEWTSTMDRLLAQGDLLVGPGPHAPTVDWSSQSLVLVALGQADGYSVEVTHASRAGRTLLLDVHVEVGART